MRNLVSLARSNGYRILVSGAAPRFGDAFQRVARRKQADEGKTCLHGRLELGPDLELVLRSHTQQTEDLAAGLAGDLLQRMDDALGSRHQSTMDVLAIVDDQVDHPGDLADGDQQAGARRGAVDQDAVAVRPGERNQVPHLAFLLEHAGDETVQRRDRRRGIGTGDRAVRRNRFLLGDESQRSAAEHVSAAVGNTEAEAFQHVFGQGPGEVAHMFFPQDGRTAESEALLHVGQLGDQEPVGPQQDADGVEEAGEIADMFDHMPRVDGIECAALGDQPSRELGRQVTGVDLVTLGAGGSRGDRIGFDTDDLPVAGTAQGFQERAVVAADVDRPCRILAGHRRRDQVLEVPRPLEAGRVGIRLAVDQVGGNGVDDLQQTAISAALEADRKSRVRIIPRLPEVVRDRKVVQGEKERKISPLAQATLACAHPPLVTKKMLSRATPRVSSWCVPKQTCPSYAASN